MNLEELKILWHAQEADFTDKRVKREEVLAAMEGKGRTALQRINRNILLEMGLVSGMGIIWLLMLLAKPQGGATWEFILVFASVIGSAIFYRWKYKSLNHVQLGKYNVKEALTHTTGVMKRFMRIYKWVGYALIPVLGTLGFVQGLWEAMQDAGIAFSDLTPGRWVLFTAILVGYNILAVLFIRWYIRRLYGVHEETLSAALTELNES